MEMEICCKYFGSISGTSVFLQRLVLLTNANTFLTKSTISEKCFTVYVVLTNDNSEGTRNKTRGESDDDPDMWHEKER